MDTITMKGSVVAAFAVGTTVQIWVSSPTGDSSDSHIFEMPATSEAHAETIASAWRSVWSIK